jgi:hypothetical protein
MLRNPHKPFQFGLVGLFGLTTGAAIVIMIGRATWGSPLFVAYCQVLFSVAYVAAIILVLAMLVARTRS